MARTLMDAVGHLVSRAVESPRYALPAARRCIAVVERETGETFLESLLNTCQQWYHDRDKVSGRGSCYSLFENVWFALRVVYILHSMAIIISFISHSSVQCSRF